MPDLSIGLKYVWEVAAAEAAHARHELIGPAHLFLGLCTLVDGPSQRHPPDDLRAALRAEGSALAAIFTQFGIDPTALRRDLRQRVGEGNFVGENRRSVSRSPAGKSAFTLAATLAADAPSVTALHLLTALLDPDNKVGDDRGIEGIQLVTFLREKGVDIVSLQKAALSAAAAPSGTLSSFLSRLGKDLTQLARDGKIHECIGRRNEMLRVIQTLSRDSKNNPLLIGDPGVGKTAIVEGLAWRIAQGKSLPGKRIVQVQIADLVADTKYRGEFEQRLQSIVREIGQAPEVVLFLDEIHTLIGAGDSTGGLDAANILKPALARGELRCIGATTIAEFRKHIEKDPALERRFQPIMVEEPSQDETFKILQEFYIGRLTERHRVTIESAALHAAVRLSAQYLPDRRLPDKAIDLLDEACARVATPVLSVLPGDTANHSGGIVTAETVAQLLSEWTGVLVAQMTETEQKRLMRMEEELKSQVIGQEEACKKVAQAIQRARAGLKAPGRPIAVFLFIGASGVGKTGLAKATARFLFGSDKAMVRIDMSEFIEKHTVSRLIGAPPSYIGHEEEGQVTGALRRRPYCVVLLDEVEKAHPDVLNLFLQVFDDGRLTDSKGRTVDATNALFIMTSNVGHEAKVGFRPEETKARTEALLAEVQKTFRPEFLNRLDDIIVFGPLAPQHAKRIAALMLRELEQRLKTRDIGIDVKEAALEWLSEEGLDEMFGARPLRRIIEQHIENPIAGKILREEVRPGHAIVVDLKDGALVFQARGGETL